MLACDSPDEGIDAGCCEPECPPTRYGDTEPRWRMGEFNRSIPSLAGDHHQQDNSPTREERDAGRARWDTFRSAGRGVGKPLCV